MHHPLKVYIGCDVFLKENPEDTLPLYLESIEHMSVKGARCYFEADKKVLEDKVFTYYNGATHEESFAAFERFAKVTAILLMSKQIVTWRARGSVDDAEAWLKPVRDLARRLDFCQLLKIIESAQPAQWYAQCNKSTETFQKLVMAWFENVVVQYLLVERKQAVRQNWNARLSQTINTRGVAHHSLGNQTVQEEKEDEIWIVDDGPAERDEVPHAFPNVMH
eukprot:gnl/MRDRNA2_/MRDRNA2_83529_c0_seq2.p1 gnl/MRDRNA2_/MRDRNA2_83529_c0~~gnl/MRDRNA2_/MRDRNA2_83529_c0_seq2.p1  ORF type:complete len:221 (+),score=38.48 gnl/MRDRNA2_/MRDRNA2_83529_c0_seq2:307-969(+)